MTRKEIYKKIKTPEELYQFMQKYMQYGYISKNKEIYTLENKDFQNNWWKEYTIWGRNLLGSSRTRKRLVSKKQPRIPNIL